MPNPWLFALLVISLLASAVHSQTPVPSTGGASGKPASLEKSQSSEPTRFVDFVDPTYGSRVRQIYDSSGDEHDLYHYRSVFNADNSRLLGIRTPSGSTDYEVTLFDGDGRLLKKLFTQKEYDWTLAWDRREPRYFYTQKNGTVFRYDVDAGNAETLQTFAKPSIAGPSGLSLNVSGNRVLLRMTDQSVRTYRLPALDDERICVVDVPDGWYANWDKLRFTGHQDFFAVTLEQKRPRRQVRRNYPPTLAFTMASPASCCTLLKA